MTLVLGELAGKEFRELNEKTSYGFRVRLDKLLVEGLREVRVRRVSNNLEVVEILE
ncbi:MAG: hypothetical protein NXY59_09995 [Aigarchaeota archaeon]|nr:hypothetical protein [Candidatus Pelearchaeum maunauluense]